MRKFYPLLSYNSRILGIVSIVIAGGLIAYSLIFTKINEDISIWLFCFGLFCFGYRKEKDEKDEKDESNRYLLYRYHSFRISFALTTVIILICSSSFIFGKIPVRISCLYALLFLGLSYNIVYFIIKKSNRKSPAQE